MHALLLVEQMGETTPTGSPLRELDDFHPTKKIDQERSPVSTTALDGRATAKEDDREGGLTYDRKSVFFGVGTVERLWLRESTTRANAGRKETDLFASTSNGIGGIVLDRKATSSYSSRLEKLEALCIIYLRKEKWADLKETLNQLLILKKSALGERHLDNSLVLQRIGDFYRLRGNFDSALSFYTDALTIRWLHLGTDHIMVASTLGRIADMNFIGGAFLKAKDVYKEAIRVKLKNPGNDDSGTTLHKLGLVLHTLGDKVEAARILEQAMRLKCVSARTAKQDDATENEGDMVTDTLQGLNALDASFEEISLSAMVQNMIKVQVFRGDYAVAQAQNCLQGGNLPSIPERSCCVESRTHGVGGQKSQLTADQLSATQDTTIRASDHIGTITSRRKVHFANPLLLVWEIPRIDPEDVKMLFYRETDFSQFRKESNLERYRPRGIEARALHVATTLDGIGRQHFECGDWDRALEAFTHALRVKTDTLANDQTSIAGTIYCIGDIYLKQEKLDQALNAYSAALQLRKIDCGDTHLSLASTLLKIAVVHNKMGNPDLAVGAYDEVLKLRTLHLGPSHVMVATIHESIGLIQFKQGRYRLAMNNIKQALRIKEAQLGCQHKGLVGTLVNVGNLYFTRGSLDQAMTIYSRALFIMRRNFDDFKQEILITLQNVGNIFLERDDYEQALSTLNASLQIAESLGPGTHHTAAVLESIGDVKKRLSENVGTTNHPQIDPY